MTNSTAVIRGLGSLAVMLSGCAAAGEAPAPNVVEIVARGLTFEAPDSIRSGWTTLRLTNESELIHFAVVERMPDGVGIAEQQEHVAPVFQEGMDLLNAGDPEGAMAMFGELPDWFGEIVFMGGPGFISPGRTAQATVYLEPGTYLIECYVKTGGVFHSFNPSPSTYGMVHEITVTEDSTTAPPPVSTIQITLSNARGIEVGGEVTPGEHTVAVRFEDQTVHENFVGHDVHLARLGTESDIERLASWIDWTQPNGLETPAPVEFLGGIHEMPEGETGYFTVRLGAGRYAWISEVTNAAAKGMVQAFTVSAASEEN